MSNFKTVQPIITDPELMGEEEPKSVAVKSNVVSNMTIVVSSVVLTIIVILLVWQAYKMFTETEEAPPKERQSMRNREGIYYRGDPRALQQDERSFRQERPFSQPPQRAERASHSERSPQEEQSKDDAALSYKARPILKSGGRISDRVVEITEEEEEPQPATGNVELAEIVVDDPLDEEGWKGELLKELSEDSKNVSFLEPEQSCNFVAKSGKNKGKACGGAVVGNGKCKAHNK